MMPILLMILLNLSATPHTQGGSLHQSQALLTIPTFHYPSLSTSSTQLTLVNVYRQFGRYSYGKLVREDVCFKLSFKRRQTRWDRYSLAVNSKQLEPGIEKNHAPAHFRLRGGTVRRFHEEE